MRRTLWSSKLAKQEGASKGGELAGVGKQGEQDGVSEENMSESGGTKRWS